MTKKDFQLIASALKNALDIADPNGDDYEVRDAILNEFCYALEKSNPRFDGVRFKQAVNGK